MNFRDLFFFSKGERRALVALLCLIAAIWLALLVTEKASPLPEDTPTEARDTIRGVAPSPRNSPASDSPKPPASTAQEANAARNIPKTNRPAYERIEKYPAGTVVELNSADTVVLKKVPGIGSTFARRIVKYRELLGGFCSVDQLAEVYGIDADRFTALQPWFIADTILIRKLSVNHATFADLLRHPYLNKEQVKAIDRLRRQKGRLAGKESLLLLPEFTEHDLALLSPYITFE